MDGLECIPSLEALRSKLEELETGGDTMKAIDKKGAMGTYEKRQQGTAHERSFWKAWFHIAKWRGQEVDALKEGKAKVFHSRWAMKITFHHWLMVTTRLDRKSGAYYCSCCDQWLNGPTQWEDQKKGSRHRRCRRLDLAAMVVYAIHDPVPWKTKGPSPHCLFLVCPQEPLNDVDGLGELLPWVCMLDWRDITHMNASDWGQMDRMTAAIQSCDLDFLSLDDAGFELFLNSKQYLRKRPCSDGTHIYEAFLGASGTTASPFHYRLPAKLAAWMEGAGLGSLTFKVGKWQHAWSDSKHYVWRQEHGADPAFEKSDGAHYWFTTGSKGVPGDINMQIGDGRPEALPVIFQQACQGGPIDPFLSRPLSPLMQQHLLSSQLYKMPLHRNTKKGHLPKTAVAVMESPQGDCLDSLMALEWQAESPQACMRLTLRYDNDDSIWWVVTFQRVWHGCRFKHVRIYHHCSEAGHNRYTYFDADNTELDLPAGVYESMVNRIREMASSAPVPQEGAVYCKECELWLNGEVQWRDHEIGKKHGKRKGKCSK